MTRLDRRLGNALRGKVIIEIGCFHSVCGL
jgi:hypothetical protein